ncbi:hypothetical protein [Streptomyces sp. NPDC054804]
MAWHPRNSADPGHRWFRERPAAAVTAPAGTAPTEAGPSQARAG